MRYEPIKVRKADICGILRASFPDYQGRKFSVDPSGAVTFSDLHWGGGSRNEYVAVRLFDCAGRPVPAGNAPWACPGEGVTVQIPPGFVVVEHTTFCGKDAGITVYANPVNMPRILPNRDPYDVCARRLAGLEPMPSPSVTVVDRADSTVRASWLDR